MELNEPGDITAEDLRTWLVKKIAGLTGQEEERIGPGESLFNFGLSSRQGVSISGELETWLGFALPPTLLFDHPTIDELAEFLARAVREGGIPKEDFLD